MKITFKDNPLATIIELTEEEIKELKYKIKINELEEKLFDAFYYSTDEKLNLEKVRKAVDPDYYFGTEKTETYPPLDQRVDKLLSSFIEDLKDSHMGDCTCIPCSCMKCYAESFLDIDTLDGLGKHEADFIQGAFQKYSSIEEVIDYLENWEFVPNEAWEKAGGYEEYIPRWKEEVKGALKWLKQYRKEKLNRY